MHPTSDQPDRADAPYAASAQQPYSPGEPPQTDRDPWAGPAFAPPVPVPTATVKKGRPWRVAIVAFLALLVLIAGLGNQWVTDAILKHVSGRSFVDNATRAMTTYQWRFSPRGSSDIGHLWLASLGLVATALVLTLLIVAVVCRGRGGFGQAFVGAWMAVVIATVLGGYVRAAVVDANKVIGTSGGNKANVIFFSVLSPNSSLIAAGLGFGFVVGLVAGITAVLSRHTEVVSPAVPPGYGAPAFGAPAFGGPGFGGPAYGPGPSTDAPADQPPGATAAVPGPMASPSPWSKNNGTDTDTDTDTDADSDEPQHTEVLPPTEGTGRESSGESTTQLPRSDWSNRSSDSDHTTQLPRQNPSDDDGESPRHLSE